MAKRQTNMNSFFSPAAKKSTSCAPIAVLPPPVVAVAAAPAVNPPSSNSVNFDTSSADSVIPNDIGDKRSGPVHPNLSYKLRDGRDLPSRNNWSQPKFKYMSFSKQNECAVCWVCLFYGDEKFRKNKWATGYSNWKNLTDKWDKHVGALKGGVPTQNGHKTAVARYLGEQIAINKGAIIDQIQPTHVIDEPKARTAAAIKIDLVRTLAVQGLPLRGHDESDLSSNKGAFLGMQELLGRHSQEAREAFELPKNQSWNSPDIQNQFIQVIADETLRHILLRAKEAEYWSFGADGAKDRRKKEHLSISLRFVVETDGKFVVSIF
jgi:hypothetical protein